MSASLGLWVGFTVIVLTILILDLESFIVTLTRLHEKKPGCGVSYG